MYLFTIIALIFSLLSAPHRDACPRPEYPWYLSTFTLAPPELPTGVTMTQVPEFPNAWSITNTTDIPLYVFKRSDTAVWTAADADAEVVAPNYDLAFKLVDTTLFIRNADTREWEEYAFEGQKHTKMLLRLSDDDPERLFAPLYTNANPPTAERRPGTLEAPRPQSTFLLLSYNGRFISVPITVSYALNAHHQEQVDSARSCGSGLGLVSIIIFVWTNPFCVVILGLIALAGALVWFDRGNQH